MNNTKLTTAEFIEKANRVHAGRYSYINSQYIGANNKLEVTCLEHGSWWVRADAHTRAGHGCPECKKEKIRSALTMTAETFIASAMTVHGGRYNYDDVDYRGNKSKVTVTCKVHGQFLCSPNNHLRGRGCPRCKLTGYNQGKPGYFYVLSDDHTTKVGITNRSAEQRASQIIKSSGISFTKRFSLYFDDGAVALKLEKAILKLLRTQYHQPVETYDGSTESFIDVDLTSLLNSITTEVNNITQQCE